MTGTLSIDATGTALTVPNGNVGIGTDSPDTKLHVKGDSFDVAKFERDSATSSSTVFINNNIGDGCAIQGIGSGGEMILATVTSGGVFSEKMRIQTKWKCRNRDY